MMGRRGISTQRFRILKELIKYTDNIRDGSITMLIPDIADRFGVGENTVKNVFKEMLRAVHPKHRFFSQKKEGDENIRDALQLLFEEGADKKAFREACKLYLDAQLKKTFTDERLERINKLIDFISKRPENIRYDALHQFIDHYNKNKPKNKWVTYETLKNDLYALAYATLDLPNGKKTTKKDIPPTHRTDFEKLKNAFERGAIEFEKARYVSQLFIKHSPRNDVERLLRVYYTDDEEIKQMAERFSTFLSWIKEIREQHWNSHPARAYSMVWILAGNKIHNEIPQIIERVYALHKLTKDVSAKRISVKKALESFEVLSKHFKKVPTVDEFLTTIKKEYGISHDMTNEELKKITDKVYKQLWEENFLKAEALVQYEQARVKLGNLIKEHKNTMPDGVREYYESIYKTIRRWNDPSKCFRTIPSIPKDYWKGLYRETVKKYGETIEKIRFYDDEKLNDFHKRILIIGRHLNAADRIYAEHMRVKEKNKFRW